LKERRYNTHSLPVYFVRLLIVEIFYGGLVFLLVALIFMDGDAVPVHGLLAASFIGLFFTLLPLVVVAKRRPHFTADKHGLHIYVDDFFRRKYVLWIYAAQGWGDKYLPMAISYLEPKEINWKDVKYFKLKRRYLVHQVIAIDHQRRSLFIYGGFSKRKVEIVRINLEKLRDQYK
jgi:hypothetical protein